MILSRALAPLTVCLCIAGSSYGPAPLAVAPGRAAQARRTALPRYFEANVGQFAPEIRYLARGGGIPAALTATEMVLYSSTGRVRFNWQGATEDALAEGVQPLDAAINYFIGNDPRTWRKHVPAYGSVRYRSIYPGIDLIYRAAGPHLAYDFIVSPGACPDAIVLDLEADSIAVERDGSLTITEGTRHFRQLPPRVWEETPEGRYPVAARFVRGNDNRFRFALDHYDAASTLVIDPTIEFSASFGGSTTDTPNGIAVDRDGNTYIAGTTTSPDLPVSPNAFQRTRPGNSNAFVAKLGRDGNALVYVTYLGGRAQRPSIRIPEQATAVAVDASGSAIVAGYTSHSDFPTLNAVEPSALGPEIDAFITKLRPDGGGLIYSTYLGARDGPSDATTVVVGPSGDAYVGGRTTGSQFPTTTDLSVRPRTGTAFVVRLTPTGQRVFSTRLGGTSLTLDVDHLTGLALDPTGGVYLVGTAHSRDFPTSNAFQALCPTRQTDCFAAFLTKLNDTGTRMVFSTFLGGTVRDYGAAVAVGADSNVYVTGTTHSPDFPVRNAVQPAFGGGDSDVYLAAFTAGGSLLNATYLGGSWMDGFFDRDPRVAVDGAGNVYVSGFTGSTDFPTRNAIAETHPQGPVFKSTDRGRQWTRASRGLTSSVLDLAIDPTNPDILYATTYDGVFTTTDGGDTWQPRNTGLPFRRGRAIWAVTVDPRNPSIVYTASADGLDGLYKSLDAGASWFRIDSATPLWSVGRHSIIVSPQDSNVLFLGALGIRKSEDGGRTWRDSTTGIPRGCFSSPTTTGACSPRALAIEPVPPYALYAAYSEGVFKSDDRGASWRNVSGRFVDRPSIEAIAIDPRSPGHVYAGTLRYGIMKSTDAGATWEQLDFPFAFVQEIAIDDDDPPTLYAAAGPDLNPHVWKSQDEGRTWEPLESALPGSGIRVLLTSPGRGNQLYAAGFLDSLAFLTRLTGAGAELGYSTYLSDNAPRGLTVDTVGNAYMVFGNFDVTVRKISRP